MTVHTTLIESIRKGATDAATLSVINHAVSMSLATQPILIISAMTLGHRTVLLGLLDKVVVLRRIESTIGSSAGRMSSLSLLIGGWNLIILILDHTLHVLGNDVILAYHGLLLLS